MSVNTDNASVCIDFHRNPQVNPRTGRDIARGGPVYNALVRECGPPPGEADSQRIPAPIILTAPLPATALPGRVGGPASTRPLGLPPIVATRPAATLVALPVGTPMTLPVVPLPRPVPQNLPMQQTMTRYGPTVLPTPTTSLPTATFPRIPSPRTPTQRFPPSQLPLTQRTPSPEILQLTPTNRPTTQIPTPKSPTPNSPRRIMPSVGVLPQTTQPTQPTQTIQPTQPTLTNLTERWGGANQGQRANEDTYQAVRIGNMRYFAVFDGHGAPYRRDINHVAEYAKMHLHQRLAAALNVVDLHNPAAVIAAIAGSFVNLDREMKELKLAGGSTATVILIDDAHNIIYQINLGDSRSIIYRASDGEIIAVTQDHKPNDPDEAQRVKDAGGVVMGNRVMGTLAVPRAFGDFELKFNKKENYDPINGAVSAVPTISTLPKVPGSEIILTSDAPFERDAFTNPKLVQLALSVASTLPSNSNRSENIAQGMVRSIVPRTTDDTTILHVEV